MHWKLFVKFWKFKNIYIWNSYYNLIRSEYLVRVFHVGEYVGKTMYLIKTHWLAKKNIDKLQDPQGGNGDKFSLADGRSSTYITTTSYSQENDQ